MKNKKENRFSYSSNKGLKKLSEEDILSKFDEKIEKSKINKDKIKDFLKEVLKEKNKNNEIKGGKADNMSIEDIAKKHKVSIEKIKAQIIMGIKIEMEHTNDPKKAIEISMDHLTESPEYYTKLKEMEQSFED